MGVKTFDAVAESLKWKATAGAKLDPMTSAERLAYLSGVQERYATVSRSAWQRECTQEEIARFAQVS